MQAHIRGKFGRLRSHKLRMQRLREIFLGESAAQIQRAYRRYLARCAAAVLRVQGAARDISRVFRGHMGRRYAAAVRGRRDRLARHSAAAVVIQACWKRHRVLQGYREITVLRVAATTVQRVWRGHVDRRFARDLQQWRSTESGPGRLAVGVRIMQRESRALVLFKQDAAETVRAEARCRTRAANAKRRLRRVEQELRAVRAAKRRDEAQARELDEVSLDRNALEAALKSLDGDLDAGRGERGGGLDVRLLQQMAVMHGVRMPGGLAAAPPTPRETSSEGESDDSRARGRRSARTRRRREAERSRAALADQQERLRMTRRAQARAEERESTLLTVRLRRGELGKALLEAERREAALEEHADALRRTAEALEEQAAELRARGARRAKELGRLVTRITGLSERQAREFADIQDRIAARRLAEEETRTHLLLEAAHGAMREVALRRSQAFAAATEAAVGSFIRPAAAAFLSSVTTIGAIEDGTVASHARALEFLTGSATTSAALGDRYAGLPALTGAPAVVAGTDAALLALGFGGGARAGLADRRARRKQLHDAAAAAKALTDARAVDADVGAAARVALGLGEPEGDEELRRLAGLAGVPGGLPPSASARAAAAVSGAGALPLLLGSGADSAPSSPRGGHSAEPAPLALASGSDARGPRATRRQPGRARHRKRPPYLFGRGGDSPEQAALGSTRAAGGVGQLVAPAPAGSAPAGVGASSEALVGLVAARLGGPAAVGDDAVELLVARAQERRERAVADRRRWRKTRERRGDGAGAVSGALRPGMGEADVRQALAARERPEGDSASSDEDFAAGVVVDELGDARAEAAAAARQAAAAPMDESAARARALRRALALGASTHLDVAASTGLTHAERTRGVEYSFTHGAFRVARPPKGSAARFLPSSLRQYAAPDLDAQLKAKEEADRRKRAAEEEEERRARRRRRRIRRMADSDDDSESSDDGKSLGQKRGGSLAVAIERARADAFGEELPPDVRKWEVGHVAKWFHGLGFGQYAPSAREAELDGPALLSLPPEDLRDIVGVDNPRHLRRIDKYRQRLAEPPPSYVRPGVELKRWRMGRYRGPGGPADGAPDAPDATPEALAKAATELSDGRPLKPSVVLAQAKLGRYQRVEEALARGMDADAVSGDGLGRTGLHAAALRCDRRMAAVFLRYGAFINATDKFGNTPLHYAEALDPTRDLVSFLLDRGADDSLRNNLGCVPGDQRLGPGADAGAVVLPKKLRGVGEAASADAGKP